MIIIICLNLPFEVKSQLTSYKLGWFKYTFLFSIFDVLRIFEALQIFLWKFHLKWGKNEEDCESDIFFEVQKYYSVFESRLNFLFLKWSYSQLCFDVAQCCENWRWNWQRCFDVVWRCSIQLWNMKQVW